MDLLESIKINALYSVLKPDKEYFYRKILRYFSNKFHTPLYLVEKLPIIYILEHVFEYIYENMEEKERFEELVELVQDEKDIKQKELEQEKEKISDEEFAKQIVKDSKDKDSTSIISKKPEEQAQEISKSLASLANNLQDIKVNFLDRNLFEEELEGASIINPKEIK